MYNRLSEIFSIDSFNIYSDNENYYFFRALNNRDMQGIKDGSILDINGNIEKIITDREFYGPTSGYTENSEITLEEVVNHVKMHYDKHTNCISLTSNANVAITYGRQNYEDKYVIIRVPKDEMGKNVYLTGLYILQEINKQINNAIENHSLDDYEIQKYYIDAIDNCASQTRLDAIKSLMPKKDESDDSDIYENGLEFDITLSKNYQVLSDRQNFEKNKIVLKLNVLNKRLLKKMTNRFLTQVIGLSFSSLELTHYKDIKQDHIIEIPSEIIDVFGLLQQMPKDLEYIDELKQLLLVNFKLYKNDKKFAYKNSTISDELTIDNIYNITKGKVDYKTAVSLYKKAFCLAKSKLRVKNSVSLLREIIDSSKYDKTLLYIEQNGFGIEPEITTRVSENLLRISESVSIDINDSEKKLVEYINKLGNDELLDILNNPLNTLKSILNRLVDDTSVYSDKKIDWFANSIIDNLDFTSLGVREELSDNQRKDIINSLKERSFLEIYYDLKHHGINEKDISKVLFTNIIKNKNTIDLEDSFTLEELEWFIGYNRVKGLGLNLRNYQRVAVKNINRIFKEKQFTSVILPTGAGKSYVALEQIYEHRDERMIYIAPNVEILNQLRSIIKKTYKPEEHIGESVDYVISRLFPMLTLTTYQNLKDKNTNELKDEYKINYGLVIFDELHRTGASEWMTQVNELLSSQTKDTKILGITATPERDVDLNNMADYWAQKYGYTDDEILIGKHLAYNLDIVDAIDLGIIANPRVINCTYSLIKDGTIDKLKSSIDSIEDGVLKAEELANYSKLRKNIENSNGIEQILHDSIKEDGKYIVFLPVTQTNQSLCEDDDGNNISETNSWEIIEAYQVLFRQYLFAYDYLQNSENKVKELYLKIKHGDDLSDEDKIYLEHEKKFIKLLLKIDIPGKSSALNTETNIIADTIINYMNWDALNYRKQFQWLKTLTSEKFEAYSMLGSYSEKKNTQNLDLFNDKTDKKTKFMFVMNKLNEGVHVDDITGIIWLRPLDSNSKILFLQQLGRCIRSLTPGKILTENDVPLVIDLVNNTLKVKLDKGVSLFEKDLDKLKFVKEWIDFYGRYPTYDNEEEVKYLNILSYIKRKYIDYTIEESLISRKDVKNRLIISEIIEIGYDIDLWNKEFIKKGTVQKDSETYSSIDELFEISAITREFIDLQEEIDEICKNEYSAVKWVKRIKEFCKMYQEWPKSGIFDKTTLDGFTSNSLARWLYKSGFNSGEFKYSDITDDNGNSLEVVLNNLAEVYRGINKQSDEYRLLWIRRIIDYCEKYNKWPTQDDDIKTSFDGTTSRQLSYWLINSGYSSGNFKYKHLNDENGISVEQILNDLEVKCNHIYSHSSASKVLWVKRIEEYCDKYKKWPTQKNSDNVISDGTTSNQLSSWLQSSGYNSNNFQYNDLKDDNGRFVKDILDELAGKFKNTSIYSDENKLSYVERIVEYCEKYHEWPVEGIKDKKVSNGVTSDTLAKWLYRSGFNSGKFKYGNLTDGTGRGVEQLLNDLSNTYRKINNRSNNSKLLWVSRIKEYCEKYQEWPKSGSTKSNEKVITDGISAKKLVSWLSSSGFYSGEFKYKHLKDENGNSLEDVLNELARKYDYVNINSDTMKLLWVKRIEEYCEKFGEWPTTSARMQNNRLTDGTTSKQLAFWLITSGYNSGQFKYKDLKNESGKLIIEILDKLKYKYKNKKKVVYKPINDDIEQNIALEQEHRKAR